MIKRILAITVIFLFVFQGLALAQSGQIILEDVAYGAVIGGMLGGAVYLLDQDDFAHKIGTGVALGAIAGFVLGISDSRSVVEIDKNEIKFALPPVNMEKKAGDVFYSTDLLRINF